VRALALALSRTLSPQRSREESLACPHCLYEGVFEEEEEDPVKKLTKICFKKNSKISKKI